MWTALGIAGLVIAALTGLALWMARRAGVNAEKQKQIEETLDAVSKIDDAHAKAVEEVNRALGNPDYRDRLKRMYRDAVED